MMGKLQIKFQFLLFLIACSTLQILASDPLFYESFDEAFEGRWIVSEKDDYKGVWKHSKSEGHDDYGLLVSEKARKYAIVKVLDEPVSLNDGTIVLQYETRLQNGLECGGAYIKYLRPQETGWIPKEFDNESPYSIMFGPDKCGSTNKVHFILKHKNPKTGKFVEHHLKYPPSVPSDKLSHVYTAILKPDNDVRILIDGEEKKKANFLSADEFEPALIPTRTIPDPEDKKPDDWDERANIPDPTAVKPEDWDEDAPMEIEDEEAVKPDGWLEDEPEEIDDPEATKPEDWDDEEDGAWEAPKTDNPKCEAAPGCGEWKRPTKRNPAYKGKWHAPLIDNPNYKGIWKPQEIPNPEYFELDRPNSEPIAAIGIEIWTMQDGILFDNVLIANDEKVAESYREKTWKPKYEVEKEKQREEEKAAGLPDGLAGVHKKVFDTLYKVADIPLLGSHKIKIIDLIEKGEKQPNLTIGILVSVVVVISTIIFRILFGVKKPAAPTPGIETSKKERRRKQRKKMLASSSSSTYSSPFSLLSSSKSISSFTFAQRLSIPNQNGASFSIEAKATTRRENRTARHVRIRKKVEGTPERPRLSVYRSNKHLYVQVIDDTKMHTLASASTMQKPISEELDFSAGPTIDVAKKVGEAIAKACTEKGITKVAFDRGGYPYHGRIEALAAAAREHGLQF